MFTFSDPTTIHVRWESTIGYWIEELAEAGLVHSDIAVDINASALQYEIEKKDRMRRNTVRNFLMKYVYVCTLFTVFKL